MKVAPLTRVKNELSRYVEHVRRGGRVRILVHGVPAADLVPVADSTSGALDPGLAELERRGVVRRGEGGIPPEILRPGPRIRGAGLSRTVIEERTRGR
jgi:prevent-host-death family protein